MKGENMNEVSRQQFINILKSHHIEFYISKNDRIIALDSYDLDGKEYFEDITDYTFSQLKSWLGY
jgi:hypothetical protein